MIRQVRRCGRMDDHEPHHWKTPFMANRTYKCPGPPLMTKAEKMAVDKSVRVARGEEADA